MTVELSITVWERTFDQTLTKTFFDRVRATLRYPFDSVRVVINNVTDLSTVAARAEALLEQGVISAVTVVDEMLPVALEMAGLRLRHLRPVAHYTDHFLVKFAASSANFVCHWDTDAAHPEVDWIGPGKVLLESDPSLLVVSPSRAFPHTDNLERMKIFTRGPFDIGFGFSDQVFLARRADFAKPIYRSVSPATWWQPTSHLAPIFEQRVDAYMRRHLQFRAVYRDVLQAHDGPMATQAAGGPVQRSKRRLQHEVFTRLQSHMRVYRPRWVEAPAGRRIPTYVLNARDAGARQ